MSTQSAAPSAGGPPAPTQEFVLEVPSSLKQLARLVVRGFYCVEDVLIIDMLVRHPCMREDDISGLLKFDKKMLRSRMTILKNDKFIQTKQRIETDEEGKVVKMNCYFINFRTFVNIVRYKLDHMRKKMETSERDQTSRSSFKCSNCGKNFTDLEANQLLEPSTGEMRCTFCSGNVDEDEASGPQQDSRKLLARFNLDMKPLYELLHLVENVNLAPDLLEPEPVDLDLVTGKKTSADVKKMSEAEAGGKWSGDATRTGGLREDAHHVEIAIGDDAVDDASKKKKPEVPAWITQSAIGNDNDGSSAMTDVGANMVNMDVGEMDVQDNSNKMNDEDEISLMLLRHERKAGDGAQRALIPGESDSDKSDDSDMEDILDDSNKKVPSKADAAKASSSEDEGEGDVPVIKVGKEVHLITNVTEEVIERMTNEEKEKYTQVFQEYYAHMYE